MKKLLGLIAGFLGALGGTDGISKAWRRIGIPIFIMIIAFIKVWHWSCIFIMSMSGFLSMGYGLPSLTDKGSTLGRFCLKIASRIAKNETKRHFIANLLTRGILALGYCLSLLPVAILRHNWIVYIIGNIGVILTFAWLSWRNLGYFKIKDKTIILSEFIPYSVLGIFAIILIGV